MTSQSYQGDVLIDGLILALALVVYPLAGWLSIIALRGRIEAAKKDLAYSGNVDPESIERSYIIALIVGWPLMWILVAFSKILTALNRRGRT